jgi:hypothetical protein
MREWKHNALLVLVFLLLLAWVISPLPRNVHNLLVEIAVAGAMLVIAFLLLKKWIVKSNVP